MQIHFTGHHLKVTDTLKHFTQEKFEKLERHFNSSHITGINVVFNIEKLKQIAEATIIVTKGDIHAKSESDDMYTAIDLLVDKLDRQLLKRKEKLNNHRDEPRANSHIQDIES